MSEEIKSLKGRVMKPLAGDPGQLAGEVARMKNVGTTIEKLVKLLGDVHDGKKSHSQKVDQLKDTAGEAKKALAKAQEIYTNTGAALGDYQQQLATSVKDSKTAYDNAVALLPSYNKAKTAYDGAVQHKTTVDNRTTTTPADEQQQKTDSETAQTNVTSTHKTFTGLETEMNGYKRAWDTAKDDLDSAAETARGKIKTAIDKSPAKDSWWDNFSSFLSSLASILGWVALALTIVAIFLTGPLALAFIAIATALTVVNLIIHASLAITGKGSWLDVAFDVIGLIPFGKLAKSGTILERLSATGKGTLDNLNVVGKFRDISTLPRSVLRATAQNAFSRSGNFWADWAQNARNIMESGPSRWNVWESLKAGGSSAYADMADTLARLPGRNSAARLAIADAWAAGIDRPETATAVDYLLHQGAGIGYQGYSSVGGGDWVTNQVVGLFGADDSPSAADLKSRVMSPYMDGMPKPAGVR
jgi:hypothetical protein